MKKQPNKLHASWTVAFVFLGLLDLGVLLALLLKGKDIALFHPKGLIAQQEFNLILLTSAVLLTIALPSLFFFYYFAWKYRETNKKAAYEPHARHGKFMVPVIWAIPCFFMLVMAVVMWSATHKLDPHTPIDANVKPLTIEVIALRWKWLFIYPEQHVAAVNYLQLPIDTPVQFELTADEAPMSSFWIPHLSGQLYAMTGHVNTLNVMAATPGLYEGSSAEINGAGFAGMKFATNVSTKEEFDQWVDATAGGNSELTSFAYAGLVAPSQNNHAQFYGRPAPNLYDTVVMKYMGSHNHGHATANQAQTEMAGM